jgi:hypothetical protein
MIGKVLIGGLLCLASAAFVRAADNPIPEEFRTALEKGDTIELYSLEPEKGERSPDDVLFHGTKVLGKTQLKKDSRAKVVAAFVKSVGDANQKGSEGCFDPRHGIRVQHGGKVYDFEICFECKKVYLYKDDDKQERLRINIGGDPEDIFNTILKDAKIKLPKPPKS